MEQRDLVDAALDLEDLRGALESAWSEATSADSERWTGSNPAWGQCAVTALAVQDYLGGTLLRGEVGPISHYWNVLPSGEEIDLTLRQFGDGVLVENVEPRTRDHVLSYPETQRRYDLLARLVRAHLNERLLART